MYSLYLLATLLAAPALIVSSAIPTKDLGHVLDLSTVPAEGIHVSGIEGEVKTINADKVAIDPEYEGDVKNSTEYRAFILAKYLPLIQASRDVTVANDTNPLFKRVGPFPDGAQCQARVRAEEGWQYDTYDGLVPVYNTAWSEIRNNIQGTGEWENKLWWGPTDLIRDAQWHQYDVWNARPAWFQIKVADRVKQNLEWVNYNIHGRPEYRNMANSDGCWNWGGYDAWPGITVHYRVYFCSYWCDNHRW